MQNPRHVYMVLSPRSLSYSRGALESLFHNSLEPIQLRLITDSKQDKEELSEAISAIDKGPHLCTVYSEEDLVDQEARIFAGYDNLRTFRRGHPCWRKITDPLLLSDPGAELVLLDPDIYFPNRFQFEETPQSGLLLMWQKPNCLYPPEVVRTAIRKGIRLAHHVDIGVAHWRASADLDWLDWLVGELGGSRMPRIMHIEAIVWAALAMQAGGGYLDPSYWRCWRRSPAKRIRMKLGASGPRILSSEPWNDLKCFHAGGEAKAWLQAMRELGLLDGNASHCVPGRRLPFIELTPAGYARERAFKRVLQSLGYYHIFHPA
jgi:hypothetical protein